MSRLLLFPSFIVLECPQIYELRLVPPIKNVPVFGEGLQKVWVCLLLFFKVVGTIYLFHSDHPGEAFRHSRKSDGATENSTHLISGNQALVSQCFIMLLWFLGIFLKKAQCNLFFFFLACVCLWYQGLSPGLCTGQLSSLLLSYILTYMLTPVQTSEGNFTF